MTRAFTLLELVVVITIVGIVSAVAIPRFTSSTQRYRADAAAARLAADIRRARETARTSSQSVLLAFNLTRNSYAINGVRDLTNPGLPGTIVQLDDPPYLSRVALLGFGGATNITFDGYGSASAGGSIVLKAGKEYRRVTLDAASGSTQITTLTKTEVQTLGVVFVAGTNPAI